MFNGGMVSSVLLYFAEGIFLSSSPPGSRDPIAILAFALERALISHKGLLPSEQAGGLGRI